MKKHFFGLTLFSFIVSAAAILYSFFYISTEHKVSALQIPIIACEMKGLKEKEIGSTRVKQAVLNPETGFFIFEVGCAGSSKQTTLYFYQKNKKNTELIATEKIDLKKSVNCQSYSSLYKSFAWAKGIGWGSNIYVIARSSELGKESFATFDELLAVPVLMAESGSELTID